MFVENPEINQTYHVIITEFNGIVNIRLCEYLGVKHNYSFFKDIETGKEYFLFEIEGFVYQNIRDAVSGAMFLFDATFPPENKNENS